MRSTLNLQVSEDRFRRLIEEAPFSAALLTGPDFVLEIANSVSLKLWGKDASIIGKPLLAGMPEMADQEVYTILKKVFYSGVPYEGKEHPAYLETDDGPKKIYVNLVYQPIHDKENNTIAVLAIGYDVSHEVEARQKLAYAEERLRLAIESAGIGTFDFDYQTDQTETSQKFNEIFGFTETTSPQRYLSRIHPEDKHITDAAQNEALKSGKLSFESRLLLPNKSIRWVKINGSVIVDNHQTPLRLTGTARDITAEKESFQKLQESEERFRMLITETPEVGVGLYVGEEMSIQYVNDVMLRFWGKDDSIIGKTWHEALPELENQPFYDQLKSVYKTGIPYSGQEVKAVLRVDDKLQTGYFTYTYKALTNSNGQVYAIHHMAIDVTDQVKAKFKLIESEENVRQLFEQTPIGIGAFTGESFIVTMANEALLHYWGRKREEVINKPMFEVLPEVKDQFEEIVTQVYKTGVPYKASEAPATLMKNGKLETIYVNLAFEPQRDVDGAINGLLVIVNEVTDLVKSKKEAEENERRLNNLANSMPQVVWIANTNGDVTYYNDRVHEFAGAIRRDNGTWAWEGVVHPDDRNLTAAAWNNAVQSKTVYQVEHRIQMRNGEYRWHLSRAYPFLSDHDEVKWYGTATDVHDQKRMEMNLESIVKERTLELQRSNDDLQQFAHVASHDLKEPVRKIKTFTHLLRDEYSDTLGERGNSFLNKIITSTDRMYSMINGVLNYASMPTVGNVMEVIDVNTIIRNIISDLEILIQEKKAVIKFDHLLPIKGIPDLIYQLFYNLINNSLKFSKENVPAEITIQSRQVNDKRCTQFIITDNGIGFDSNFAEKIFVTFVRLNPKDKYEGTGLGLALAKKIVERHGGKISATGEKDKGAQFNILLPTP